MSQQLHQSKQFLQSAIVTTTGKFTQLQNVKQWIQRRGGTYVPWSPRLTHLLVGSETSTTDSPSWKLQYAQQSSIVILHESDILKCQSTELWVDKYAPAALSHVIGHAQQIKDLMSWLQGFTRDTKPVAALLTGPPGIGKTTTAHLCAKQAGYEIVELNASDMRSASAIREIFGKAARASCVGASVRHVRRLIILDEVDGMSASDRGGLAEITKFLREGCGFPVLCLANERTSPKLKGLGSICLDLRFSRPTKTVIAKSLLPVLRKEGLNLTTTAVEELCEANGNDIRSILNSLQFAAASSNGNSATAGTKDAILRSDIFSATGNLFGASATASLDQRQTWAFVDHSMIPLMVFEGYPKACERGGGDCWKAAEAMSTWDLTDARIGRSQAWGLLPAAMMSVVEAATVTKGPAPFQIFPQWLGKNSKRLKHRRYMNEVRNALVGIRGESGLIDTRAVLKARLFSPALAPAGVVSELQTLGLTRDHMLEYLTETCFEGHEITVDSKKKAAITREWKKACPPEISCNSKQVQVAESDAEIVDLDDPDELDVVDL